MGERCARAGERRVVLEGAQQLVVALVRLVGAREDRVDDAQPGVRIDALVCHAVSGDCCTGTRGGVLERAHNRRADRDDTPAALDKAWEDAPVTFSDAAGISAEQFLHDCGSPGTGRASVGDGRG